MQTENNLLKKRVNLFDGISIVAGAMIGSGIFIVSADIARSVGSPGWLMIVWLISGIITIIGALSYGELASMMPHVGGQYVYLKEAYHPSDRISLRMDNIPGYSMRFYCSCGSRFCKIQRCPFSLDLGKECVAAAGSAEYQQYNGNCNRIDSFSYMAEYQGYSYRQNCCEYISHRPRYLLFLDLF